MSSALPSFAKPASSFDPHTVEPDPDIKSCQALVIDANPTSRSTLAAMLRDFGVGTVVQAGRIADARRQLETRVFDVVLCDYHFDGASYNGQDLLDDLRRAQLLPYSTVFIMVTGEASYAKVAEAAESALDGYLLKPHNATALAERVYQARHRKRVLRSIFEAIEGEDFERAAELCLKRFAVRGKYWLYAARIGAELLLRLGRHDDARKLFEAVIESNAVPWARLGVARAQADTGQLPSARRTLESLLIEEPSFADAYDVMGRVQVEQGDLEEALATYRRASELTPSSIARLQKEGMLAFYLGQTEESARALDRAVSIGITSKMFDYQTVVLLAMANFDKRDAKAVHRCHDNVQHVAEKAPNSQRLRRFVAIINIFKLLLARQLAQVVSEIKALAGEIREPGFDFEMACNLMATLARLRAAEVQLADDEIWITGVAKRFCASKATVELLAQAAGRWAPYGELVQQAYKGVLTATEQAMTLSVRGDPRGAAQALLEQGGQTLNAKLIDTARLVVHRYQARIDDAETISAAIEELRSRYATGMSQVRVGQASTRQAGGLSLRAATAKTEADGDAVVANG